MSSAAGQLDHETLAPILRRYWGFDTLRPMQDAAIRCGVEGRDSLVVMPTGGGKSLCFQVPPLITGRLGVVVSPLIALMKDQVDGLRLAGYPAAALNSHTTPDEAREITSSLDDGSLRLLFVAPERLFAQGFTGRLDRLGVRSFAIDEAHCISQWGHDFRPEYRRLAELRDRFPAASMHAFTATATPTVRDDIASQLRLREPEVIVGRFDRPNLTYRVVPRADQVGQIEEAARRHAGRAVIVYTITRKSTEEIASELTRRGVRAEAYHAGLGHAERRAVQEDFAHERLNVVVATVAFGMGIDRSDVRCVVHAAHPKSIEAYQQETGRAGRDGLPAECLMLFSGADTVRWHQITDMSSQDAASKGESVDPAFLAHQHEMIDEVRAFCLGGQCRHAALSEYFGQAYEAPSPGQADGEAGRAGCGACDVCLGDVEPVPDAALTAQKIVSCVARIAKHGHETGRGVEFGAAHLAAVLRGAKVKQIAERGHETLTTYGILAGEPDAAIRSYIQQLIDQDALRRSTDGYSTVNLGPRGWDVMRGRFAPALVRAKIVHEPGREHADAGLSPEELGLFEALRELRRSIADERSLPAYTVFTDRTLQLMARARPTSDASVRKISGVGEQKARTLGPRFTEAIADYCRRFGVEPDREVPPQTSRPADARPKGRSTNTAAAWRMFDEGMAVPAVCGELGLAITTVARYLSDYIVERKISDVSAWVDAPTQALVRAAANKVGRERLTPIFEELGGTVPYEQIRWTLAAG